MASNKKQKYNYAINCTYFNKCIGLSLAGYITKVRKSCRIRKPALNMTATASPPYDKGFTDNKRYKETEQDGLK
jgi:hypothetical protein